jgi:hypothetical protein
MVVQAIMESHTLFSPAISPGKSDVHNESPFCWETNQAKYKRRYRLTQRIKIKIFDHTHYVKLKRIIG